MNESQRLPLLLPPLSTACKADEPGFAGSLVFLVLFRNAAFSHPPSPPREPKSCPRRFVSRPEAWSAGDVQTSSARRDGGVGEEEELCVTPRRG